MKSEAVVKLRDYNERWRELEASENLFAIVVMAHLKTRATRHDPEDRLRWKIQLVRHLYKADHERQDVLELLRFIDWVLRLPLELEQRFDEDMERFEAETKMRYVTTWERKGIEKGIETGLQQGIETGLQQGIETGLQQSRRCCAIAGCSTRWPSARAACSKSRSAGGSGQRRRRRPSPRIPSAGFERVTDCHSE